MGIISWVVVGLTAGFWAGVIVRGGGFGCISDIIGGGIGLVLALLAIAAGIFILLDR